VQADGAWGEPLGLLVCVNIAHQFDMMFLVIPKGAEYLRRHPAFAEQDELVFAVLPCQIGAVRDGKDRRRQDDRHTAQGAWVRDRISRRVVSCRPPHPAADVDLGFHENRRTISVTVDGTSRSSNAATGP